MSITFYNLICKLDNNLVTNNLWTITQKMICKQFEKPPQLKTPAVTNIWIGYSQQLNKSSSRMASKTINIIEHGSRLYLAKQAFGHKACDLISTLINKGNNNEIIWNLQTHFWEWSLSKFKFSLSPSWVFHSNRHRNWCSKESKIWLGHIFQQ